MEITKYATRFFITGILALFAANSLLGETGKFPAGITQSVTCIADSSQRYCLFLPSYYQEEESWPVIFLFDPAGDGVRAVELFAPAAEEFGYIIAASNTTQNGAWEDFLMGANALFKDVEKRFRIDPYRRYTAGFSGAAEAASGLAVMYDGIIGVIGCGSGFSPNYAPHFDVDFHYIGLIGDRDFHYQDMQKLRQTMERYHIDHYILVYPGGHDWPPANVIRQAFIWLQFKAMKHDIIAIDYGLVFDFYDEHMHLADSLEQAGNIPGAYAETIKIMAFLDDLKRLDQVQVVRDRLARSPALQQYMSEQDHILMREQLYTQSYTDAFNAYKAGFADGMTPEQPIKWWNQQVKLARSMMQGKHDSLESILGGRLIDFIWRNAYKYYKTVEGTEFYPIAIKYLDIWKVAQPSAISPYFFAAIYYTQYNKPDKAISNLREAVRNGLSDPALLENDPVLKKLEGEPAFMAIIQRLYADEEMREN